MVSIGVIGIYSLITYGCLAQAFECSTNTDQMPSARKKRETDDFYGLDGKRMDPSERTFGYYFREGATSEDNRKDIRYAIEVFQNNTCLRMNLVEPNYEGKKIEFTAHSGCWTSWGDHIVIGIAWCGMTGITHEIGHAYGWGHEQSRIDREDHIHVFRGYGKGDFHDVPDIPYDLFSVMHYPVDVSFRKGYTFASVEREFSARVGRFNPGIQNSKKPMSFYDIKRANRQFWCNENCINLNTTECKQGGYLGPPETAGAPCKCKCPPSTTGDYCEGGTPLFYTKPCGGKYEDDATINTPGYPNGRYGDQHCAWIFKNKANKRIKIVFEVFDIGYQDETTGDCHRGLLDVRTTDYFIGNFFCGGMIPVNSSMVTSVNTSLTLVVETMWSAAGRGLYAHVSYVEPGPSYDCSHNSENVIKILDNSDPVIVNYNTDTTGPCTWNFEAMHDRVSVSIKWKQFNVVAPMSSDKNCVTLNDIDGKIAYTYCNGDISNVTSVGKKLSLTAAMNLGGSFIAEVTGIRSDLPYSLQPSGCNSTDIPLEVGAKPTNFISPNSMYWAKQFDYHRTKQTYPPNSVCEWNYVVPNGNENSVITIEFLHMDTEFFHDRLEIISGSKKSIVLCDKKKLTVTGKTLQLRFSTDETVQKSGFYGTIQATS